MKISIAMASYNGATHIAAQLDSFARQTRQPDEIVICDDGSTDDTPAIVAAFAQDSPFPVRFEINENRLGFTRNFERAILRCTGDIIFLSDQDDVWFDDKIETIVARFAAAPGIQVVVNDQIMTDADLRPGTATKLANLKRIGRGEDGLIEGCCTALTSKWARIAFPIPATTGNRPEADLLSYDRWINELALLLGTRQVVDRPLQYFRRHGSNTTSWIGSEPRAVGWRDLFAERVATAPIEAWQQRIDLLDIYARWIDEERPALAEAGIGDVDRAIAAIRHERMAHEKRIALSRAGIVARSPAIIGLLVRGGYRYFQGWKSAVRDLFRSA